MHVWHIDFSIGTYLYLTANRDRCFGSVSPSISMNGGDVFMSGTVNCHISYPLEKKEQTENILNGFLPKKVYELFSLFLSLSFKCNLSRTDLLPTVTCVCWMIHPYKSYTKCLAKIDSVAGISGLVVMYERFWVWIPVPHHFHIYLLKKCPRMAFNTFICR